MLKIKDNKESIFSPVKTDFQGMLKTFLYFAILFLALAFLSIFLLKRYDLGNILSIINYGKIVHFGIPLQVGNLPNLLIYPLLITLFIHKSFVKNLILLVVVLILFPLILSLNDMESFGMYIGLFLPVLMLRVIVPFVLITLVSRIYFRIKNRHIKKVIFILPYFIILVIAGINAIQLSIATVEDCGKIDQYSQGTECYNYVAKKTNSYVACMKLEYYDKIDNCIKEIAKVKGKDSIDPQVCGEASRTSKDGCYRVIASIKEDVSICDNIKNNIVKTTCLASINEDESICDNLGDDTERIWCRSEARKNICDQMQDEHTRSDCYLAPINN